MSAAQRLDAADGRMDGRFFGRPIVQQGAGFPQQQFVQQQAFGGFPQQAFGAPAGFAGASAAARLDAADGVIDGRFHGRPIIQQGAAFPQQTFGAPVGFGGVPTAGFGYPAAGFGGVYGATTVGGFGGNSAAAALDAADGVIDGRFHGRPIVQQGAGFPQQAFGAPVGFGGVSGFGAPVFQGTSSYVQAPPIVTNQPLVGGFQGGYIPQAGFGGASAAARLDAADGVIDGQFFGRPIVRGA